MSGNTPLLSDLSAPCQPSVELAAAGRFMDIGWPVPPFVMVSCSSRRLSVCKTLDRGQLRSTRAFRAASVNILATQSLSHKKYFWALSWTTEMSSRWRKADEMLTCLSPISDVTEWRPSHSLTPLVKSPW